METISELTSTFNAFKSLLLGTLDGNTFIDGTPKNYYRRKIDRLIEEFRSSDIGKVVGRSISIDIDFQHIISEPRLTQLAIKLLKEPKKTLEILGKKFKDVFKEVGGNIYSEITYYNVRFFNLPEEQKQKISSLGTAHIEKLITIEGMVTKVSQIKPLLKEGTYECPRCHEVFAVRQPKIGEYVSPSAIIGSCRNLQCRTTRLSDVQIIPRMSKTIDWQMIYIQEPPEELEAGMTPRAIEGILTGDYVNKVTPGVRVEITGILYLRPDFNPGRSSKRNATFDKFIDIIYIREISSKEIEEELTDEDIKLIKELAKREDIEELIVNSIAPHIYGYKEIKHGVALMLFKGVDHKDRRTGKTERGDIFILLAGDPGTAKTEFLKYVGVIMPKRYAYVSGKQATLSGLTAGIVKDRNNIMSLEAGATVLASGGIVAIDEFDKLSNDAKDSLLQVMVNQWVSINKAGINAKLPAKCSIIGAMNPKYIRYNWKKSFVENMNLDETIASRFDLIFLITDKPDEQWDREYVRRIYDIFDYEDDGNNDNENNLFESDIIEKDILVKYIRYARENIRPKMSEEAKKLAIQFFINLRTDLYKFGNVGNFIADRRTPNTIRRLAEANAKIRLSDIVTEHDVVVAYNLYQYSINEIARDEFGDIDLDTVLGMGRKKQNSLIAIKNIVEMLENELIMSGSRSEFKGVPYKMIKELVIKDKILRKTKDLTIDEQLKSILNTLVQKNDLYMPSPDGYDGDVTYRVIGFKK